MSADYVTRGELADAIADVRHDIEETEQRLRTEFTATVRYEVGRVDTHLTDQDTKINWTLGLIVTLLLALVSGLVFTVLTLR